MIRIKLKDCSREDLDAEAVLLRTRELIAAIRRATFDEQTDRFDRLLAVWRRPPDGGQDELLALADSLRWKPHKQAKVALRRLATERGTPYQEVKRFMLVSAALDALATRSRVAQRVRLGRGNWVVDDDFRRVPIVPIEDLGAVDFVNWFRKEAINLAEADLLGEGDAYLRPLDDSSQSPDAILGRATRADHRDRLVRKARHSGVHWSPLERRLIELYGEHRDLPYAGAARRLRTTTATVKSTFARLRKKLSARLK